MSARILPSIKYIFKVYGILKNTKFITKTKGVSQKYYLHIYSFYFFLFQDLYCFQRSMHVLSILRTKKLLKITLYIQINKLRMSSYIKYTKKNFKKRCLKTY